MSDPDDWAYYFGVQNFAQGHLVVDSQVHSQQETLAKQMGGQLIQYVNIGNGEWALEKAPGYVLYLVPFELMGVPRGGNVLLALGMVIVTFMLLKRLRDERAAMIGSLLMLFTPIGLVMFNRSYMDTYSSLAFLVIGGGLYLYYHLERNNISQRKGAILLFMAFLFAGWSVVSRYTNFPVAALFALHFALTRFISWRKKDKAPIRLELTSVLLGIGIPMVTLFIYDYCVFGSPLSYGYQYSNFPIKFAFQYLGEVNRNGESTAVQIILNNLRNGPRALLLGFPLLTVGIPGILVVLYYKISALFQGNRALGKWSSLRNELPWDILLILIGWFVFVFFLYLTYEWTAEFQGGGAYITFDRFYLPGLFPIAVICALVMARFPFKLYIPVLLIIAAFGLALFAQSFTSIHLLPSWITNGGQGGGMPNNGGRGPGNMPNNGFPGGNPPNGNFRGDYPQFPPRGLSPNFKP